MARRKSLRQSELERVQSLGPFPGGLDEISPETKVPEGHLRNAVNADFDRTGWFRRRLGRTLFESCTSGKSLFSDQDNLYWSDDGTLYKSPSDHSEPTAIATVDPNRFQSSCEVNGIIYYTDERSYGRIVNGTHYSGWWTDTPQHPVTVTPGVGGGLPEGDYFVTTTFVNEVTGIESGALPGVRCRVICTKNPHNLPVHDGKISVSNIPQKSGHYTNLYVTHAGDPNVYYRASMVLNGVTSWEIGQDAQGPRLETLNMEPLPAGQIVRYHRGRLFSAVGDTLYFSTGMLFGLSRLADMRLVFEDRIRIVQPVTDGIFVVADKTWWIPTFKQDEMPSREMVYPHTAVEGSGLTVKGNYFKEAPTGDVAYWFTKNAAVLGFPGGRVEAVQEDRVAPDLLTYGASLFRREDGVTSILTTGRGVEMENQAGANDSLVLTVKRNGITI